MKYKQKRDRFPDWMLEEKQRGKSYSEYLQEVYPSVYKRKKMLAEYRGDAKRYGNAQRSKED